MKLKALTSFAGILTMANGEVLECKDKAVVNDLLRAGYVEEVIEEKKPKKGAGTRESKRDNK